MDAHEKVRAAAIELLDSLNRVKSIDPLEPTRELWNGLARALGMPRHKDGSFCVSADCRRAHGLRRLVAPPPPSPPPPVECEHDNPYQASMNHHYFAACRYCGATRQGAGEWVPPRFTTIARDVALAARAYLDARSMDGKALEEERGADAIATGQAVYHARLRLEAALVAVGMPPKQRP